MKYISISIIIFSIAWAFTAINERMFYYIADRVLWVTMFIVMGAIIVYLIAQLSKMRQHNITIISTDNSRHTTTNNVLNVSDSVLNRIAESRQRMLSD